MRDKGECKSEGKQIEGAAKNKVGEPINAPDLEAKDEAERPDGKIQEKAGNNGRHIESRKKKDEENRARQERARRANKAPFRP